jgi:hypothetical protein
MVPRPPLSRPTGVWPSNQGIIIGTLEGIAEQLGKPIGQVYTVLRIARHLGFAGRRITFRPYFHNINTARITEAIAKYDYYEEYGWPRDFLMEEYDDNLERFGFGFY